MKFDLLGIGDTVTDAFIRLEEAKVKGEGNDRELCLRFADKIPYEEVYVVPAVGNSANAVVAASRLGLKSALVTNIGDDAEGRQCLKKFRTEDVSARFVKSHRGKKTNYHYVLWYGDERTILIKHYLYDYALPRIDSPRWIYLSSLGENSLPLHDTLAEYLVAHPEIKLAFQPGTFQIKFGKERLQKIYERSEIFFCNKEEAERILGLPQTEIKTLLKAVSALGPKIVVITDGPAGAYALHEGQAWKMPSYPDPKPPYERTGAGDAFSATLTSALALGLSFQDALRWGPINSMAVVQEVGAQAGLLSREKLEDYLRQAPTDYIPQKI